jgi:hypothetical protein
MWDLVLLSDIQDAGWPWFLAVLRVKLLADTHLSRVRESSVYSGRSFRSLGEADSWCRWMGRAWPSLPTTSRPVSPR